MGEETKKRILIAEDEQAMAAVLTHKFNAEGVDVVHVANGDLVVPNLQQQHFDLVLLDLMMPEMDGFEVLRLMKEQGLTTPVVVLSNLGQAEDVLKVKAYGAKDYIIKSSVTPAEILERVKEYLK